MKRNSKPLSFWSPCTTVLSSSVAGARAWLCHAGCFYVERGCVMLEVLISGVRTQTPPQYGHEHCPPIDCRGNTPPFFLATRAASPFDAGSCMTARWCTMARIYNKRLAFVAGTSSQCLVHAGSGSVYMLYTRPCALRVTGGIERDACVFLSTCAQCRTVDAPVPLQHTPDTVLDTK